LFLLFSEINTINKTWKSTWFKVDIVLNVETHTFTFPIASVFTNYTITFDFNTRISSSFSAYPVSPSWRKVSFNFNFKIFNFGKYKCVCNRSSNIKCDSNASMLQRVHAFDIVTVATSLLAALHARRYRPRMCQT